jgi:hypothetical protein
MVEEERWHSGGARVSRGGVAARVEEEERKKLTMDRLKKNSDSLFKD